MSSPGMQRPLHHAYFLAAIATVVTLGAGWGVWLLWQVGVRGRFTGLSLQDVNAHGQAQIDGWVGLFIMGFALQMFPRCGTHGLPGGAGGCCHSARWWPAWCSDPWR